MEETNETPEAIETPAAEPQEAPAAQTAPEPPSSTPSSSALSELMRREAALRDREAQVRELPKLREENERLRTMFRTDPIRALQEAGVDLDKLKQAQREHDDPAAQMRRELEELRNTVRTQQQTDHQRQVEAQMTNLQRDVDRFVSSNSSDFPAIVELKASGLVFQKMRNHMQETGQELSEHQAAKAIESDLVKVYEDLHRVFGSSANQTPEATPGTQTSIPTLTNDAAADATPIAGDMPSLDEVAALLRFA